MANPGSETHVPECGSEVVSLFDRRAHSSWANRRIRQESENGEGIALSSAPVPDNAQSVLLAARAVGLRITEACMPGVLTNLALLGRHAQLLRASATRS